jgi:uncharacterized protein YkwD
LVFKLKITIPFNILILNSMIKFVLILFTLIIACLPSNAQSSIYDAIPDVANCTAGELKDSEKQLVLAKVNSIRALHGLKPVTYNNTKDIYTQKSALITGANENLSHTPPSNWKCFSADGSTGSANSNLYIKWYYGSAIPKSEESILGWMIDYNVDVCGHRRWIIDPFLKFISFGRVEGPSKNNPQFNVHGASIYVIDNDKQNITDWQDDFVAYPFHNYPTELVFDSKNNFWLFSFTAIFNKSDWWSNRNVSYSGATLEIKDASNNVVAYTNLSSNNDGYGVPNVLKWKMTTLSKDMTYNVTIKNVTYIGNKKDFSYWFRVTDQVGTPPPAPTLTSPANGTKDQNTDLTFSWNAAGDATSYNLQVARDNAFTQIVTNQSNLAMPTYNVNGLGTNTTFYWRVSGTNIAGDGPWSQTWSFTTKATSGNRPLLSEPKDDASNVSTTPLLKWGQVVGASSYEVIVASSSSFTQASVALNQANIPGTSYTVPSKVLSDNTHYWWKVRTNSMSGPGSWSDPFSFWTWLSNSVDNPESISNLIINPNPATDLIEINIVESADLSSKIVLYSSDGSVVREVNVTYGSKTENISDLSSGTYYVVYTNSKGTYSRKLTVIR